MADAIPQPSQSAPSSDPFEHLHKMSTTAGLGSGDYVAINGTAIVAILLGVGSAIVLFNSWLLLTIPAVGVLCAVLSFVQISRSNGTQTGRVVAGIGLLLSLGFGGYFAGRTVYALINNRTDEQQIVAEIHRLGELTKSKDYAAAYQLLDDRMKNKVPQPVFEGVLGHVTSSPTLGDLQNMDWNQHLNFDTDQVTGDPLATGMVKLKYTNAFDVMRVGMGFRNVDGKWLIDQIPSFFPEDAAAPAPKKPSTPSPVSGPMGPPKP